MDTTRGRPSKKPLWWAWFVVLPAVLLTGLMALIGPYLWRESLVRSLELKGVKVVRLYDPRRPQYLFELIPAFENWQRPVHLVRIERKRIAQGILPEILADLQTFDPRIVVDLSGSPQVNQDLQELEGEHLWELDLSDQLLDAESFQRLAKIGRVDFLRLGACRFENSDLAKLSEVPGVREIFLDGSSLDDEGLSSLRGVQKLKALSLSNTQVSEEAKQRLCTALPQLNLSDD